MGGIPATDASAAFDYYIKNFNNGRPFILAGHSQGSNVLLYLLSDYMKKHPELYGRMLAAYVIGYSITQGYLAKNPHLKFAKGAKDTGVIISYNTEAPQVAGKNPVVLPGAMAINPIIWTWGEKTASAAENLGSVDMDENGKLTTLKKYADARVDKAKGVYQRYDYPFYYYNLRENAAVRTNRFFTGQKKINGEITKGLR